MIYHAKRRCSDFEAKPLEDQSVFSRCATGADFIATDCYLGLLEGTVRSRYQYYEAMQIISPNVIVFAGFMEKYEKIMISETVNDPLIHILHIFLR